VHYFASLLVRYENAVASHSLEFAAQNAMRYRLSATLYNSHDNLITQVVEQPRMRLEFGQHCFSYPAPAA